MHDTEPHSHCAEGQGDRYVSRSHFICWPMEAAANVLVGVIRVICIRDYNGPCWLGWPLMSWSRVKSSLITEKQDRPQRIVLNVCRTTDEKSIVRSKFPLLNVQILLYSTLLFLRKSTWPLLLGTNFWYLLLQGPQKVTWALWAVQCNAVLWLARRLTSPVSYGFQKTQKSH